MVFVEGTQSGLHNHRREVRDVRTYDYYLHSTKQGNTAPGRHEFNQYLNLKHV